MATLTPYTNRHQLTRALGVQNASQADVAAMRCALATPIYSAATECMSHSRRRTSRGAPPQSGEGCEYLISRALEYGGVDNLTGLMLHVVKD